MATGLTSEEMWHFDLHGYLVLTAERHRPVPEADLERMTELCDAWHAKPDEELPPPLESYKDWPGHIADPRSINRIEYCDEVFQRLALNPEIMRVVNALTGNRPQYLGAALVRNTEASSDIAFHGGYNGGDGQHPDDPRAGTGLRNAANDYQATGGRVFASFINCALTLVDVPEGAGGFVCVPGSHKGMFHPPEHLDIYAPPPSVVNVTPRRGDCVIFTELLRHGARRWTESRYPRRTVFARYSTSYASWSPGSHGLEAHKGRLPGELWELMQQGGFQAEKAVVSRLLAEQRERNSATAAPRL